MKIGIQRCLVLALSLAPLASARSRVSSSDLKTDLISGTYDYDTVDGNFSNYLREIGVSWLLRYFAGLARPEVTISQSCSSSNDACKWTIATSTFVKGHSVTFDLDRPERDSTMDMREIETTFSLTSNNQLTEWQRGLGRREVTTTLVRDFTPEGMTVTMRAGRVTSVGFFRRQN